MRARVVRRAACRGQHAGRRLHQRPRHRVAGARRLNAVYLHGFASGPGSAKAAFFRARLAELGVALAVPDLAPDFTHATITTQLAVAERAVGDGPTVVFGSSLGGWVAALLAERRPAAVRGLVLFAPAFGFVARWEARLGPAAMARWRDAGTLPVHHYGVGREVPLDIGFLDDARRFPPVPDPECPALVHAGARDDLVPLDAVTAWATARPGRELAVWEAGHELLEVLEPAWERTAAWLRRLGLL